MVEPEARALSVRYLAGGRVFTGDALLEGWGIVVDEDGMVRDLAREAPEGAAVTRVADGSVIAPGFVDIQVNGGGGVLFNETPTAEGALAIARAHRRLGTTSILPTVITDDPAVMLRAAEAAASVAAPGSGVVGVHLEGPFLNAARKGAHPAAWIRAEEAGLIEAFASLPERFGARGRVLVTLAPDCVSDAAIGRLADAGVLVSGGHSAASAERTWEALAAGLAGFTHLFNAMPPIGNRAPGIALAAMTSESGVCGIIADGIHVHPALLRLLLARKPAGSVVLVSDAMPVAGTDLASFRLGGREVRREAGRLVLEDGTLAGADLNLAGAVRVAVTRLGVSLEEALRMASLYPARFLGMEDRLGRIEPGRPAELVVLGEGLAVERVVWGRPGALPLAPAKGSRP